MNYESVFLNQVLIQNLDSFHTRHRGIPIFSVEDNTLGLENIFQPKVVSKGKILSYIKYMIGL